MYEKVEYDMGWMIDVENRYPWKWGAPGMKRQPKRKRTPEDIAKQNRRNREKYMQRLIITNFKKGDWHLVLKYRPEEQPETWEEAKKRVKKFIDKMRAKYKKAEIPFKWIMITERGKRGQAFHHHLIIEDITESINTVKLVKELWKYGNTWWTDLYEAGEYKKLAEYMVKKETKDEDGWCNYSRSRNLVKPKKKKRPVHRKKWADEPKPKKGYYIIKDSIVNGTNPVTGYPYQHYSMRRLE